MTRTPDAGTSRPALPGETPTETLWAVYTNTDLTEGRGRQFVKAFCKMRATALRLAKNGYVQGTDCPVEQVQVLVLDGKRVLPASLILVQDPNREDERRERLLEEKDAAETKAKALGLTADEIAALRRPS